MARANRIVVDTLDALEAAAVPGTTTREMDRIARDSDNVAFAMVRKALRDAGVKLATPRGFLDLESAEQRLFQDILSALASFERVKYHELLDEPMTVDNGLLTASLKVKRRVVEERYAGLIEGMYRRGRD